MKKHIKEVEKAQIYALYENGCSLIELGKKFNVYPSIILRIIRKYKNFGVFEHLKGNGRPHKASTDVKNFILDEIKKKFKIVLEKN